MTRPVHKDNAEYQSRHRAKGTACPRRECANKRRRKRLEKDNLKWLMHYFPEAYTKPFGDIHQEIADGFDESVEGGNWTAVAAPRGSGKSTEINGLVLKAVLTNRAKFAATIPFTNAGAKRALRFWKTAFVHNPRLAEDYPEYCLPFVAGKGVSLRTASIHWEDRDTPAGAQIMMSDGLIVLPDSLGVLGSASLKGNPRGLQFTTDDGTVLRPDLLAIDDPSDKKTARSREATKNNVEMIQEDVVGMAGPGQRMSILLTGTVITSFDTMSHFLGDDCPEWHAVKTGQIVTWPTDSAMELWREWDLLRVKGRKTGLREARRYYRDHKAEMLDGFAVSWAHRFDRKRKEPDAYWSAMADFFGMGKKAFLQERQNVPEEIASGLYVITPELVASRTNGMARGEKWDQATHWVMGADVNLYGLTWAVCSVGSDLATHVADYGVYPGGGVPVWDEHSTETPENAVARCVRELTERLASTYGPFTRIGWDGNFSTTAVYRLCKSLGAAFGEVIPCRGVSSQRYRMPSAKNRMKVRTKGDMCHTYNGERGWEVWFNSHGWHRRIQEGFLIEPLTPGSVSMFGGATETHDELGMHVCADRLLNVKHGEDGREVHLWENDKNQRNDISDAIVIAMVCASIDGAGVMAPKKDPNDGWSPEDYAVKTVW